MKIKIAHLLAASVLMSSSFFCAAGNAQSAPPLGTEPGFGTPPQSAPDFSGGGHRQRGGRGGDGAGGGEMREQRRQRLMERFDSNHDGTLDDSERAQMKAARERKMQQMGGGRGGNRMGMDGAGTGGDIGQQGGNGMGGGQGMGGGRGMGGRHGMGRGQGMGGGMSDEQRQERKKRMMDRFDANHDGQLDDAERSQMKQQFGKMRQGGGGGGAGERRGRFGGGGGNWGPGAGAGAGSGIPGGGTDTGAPGGGLPPVNAPGGTGAN